MPLVHAILALSVLDTVRARDALLDLPMDGEPSNEAVKLGRTTTVATQIARYTDLVRRGKAIDAGELTALFTLVARRADADLVFAEAGRAAGRHAVATIPALTRVARRALPGGLADRLGRRLVRRAAGSVLGIAMSPDARSGARAADCPAATSPAGRACRLYASALAEIERQLISFDGAIFLRRCRARGGDGCCWSVSETEGCEP